jgi:signal transduction histidine kinase
MHKGNITFTTEAGKGTTFEITLPKHQTYQKDEILEGAIAL